MQLQEQDVVQKSEIVRRIQDSISGVFVGKQDQIKVLLTGFSAGLHVLIEDVPGVGKTTLARCLAASVGLDFGRIQFTPDLLPGDVVGMTVWSQEKREFVFKEGAIMHQFVLADEVNRASPRTQSSLLEAMQEQSVTIDGRTYQVPRPFFVIATQNPVTFLGAFALPEGELDRFGISFSLGYPGEDQESEILGRFQEADPLLATEPVTNPEEIQSIRKMVRSVFVHEKVKSFIVQVSKKTRGNRNMKLGLSPRASLHLLAASQATALIDGRSFVAPEDVIAVAPNVLAHRIILSSEAQMNNLNAHDVIRKVIESVPIPTGLNE